MSEWPKYRIYGGDGAYGVQVAYRLKGPFWDRHPQWLSIPFANGNGVFETVELAEEWCAKHKQKTLNDSTVVKVIG